MHLVYADDSGSDRPSPIVVVGAVIIEARHFWTMEIRSGIVVESSLPPENLAEFEEFHASELLSGNGVFSCLQPEDRRHLIRTMLRTMPAFEIPFVYAAVDKRQLESSPFASSQPIDVAFRVCLCGVEEWLTRHAAQDPAIKAEPDKVLERLFLVIADDTDDKALKNALRKSFRSLRPLRLGKAREPNRLPMCHDDMYFGDSKASLGIQLADLCSNVMLRRLRDGTRDELFEILEPHAIAARPSPEWEMCKHILVTHEPPPSPMSVADVFGRVRATDDAEQP